MRRVLARGVQYLKHGIEAKHFPVAVPALQGAACENHFARGYCSRALSQGVPSGIFGLSAECGSGEIWSGISFARLMSDDGSPPEDTSDSAEDPDLEGKGPDHYGEEDIEGEEDDKGKSVMDQVDENGNFQEKPGQFEEGDGEDSDVEEDDEPDSEHTDKTEAQLRAMEGEEKYDAMFNQWYRSPTKNRHLLKEILSPRILDDLERWTVDRGSDIDPLDFHEFLVDIRASQKVVKSGRIVRFRAMVVVGNLKGLCGYASSKAATVQAAIENAKKRALKDLIFIPRYREHTIFERSSGKCTATKVLMWPRSRGFGLHCNDLLFQVCELVGIQDISIKVIGSRSKFNSIIAFFDALEQTRSAIEIAEEKKVYMREKCLFRPPESMRGYV